MKNVRLFLKALIVLLFLYSRFTYYADAYPKISSSNDFLSRFSTTLKSSADFVRHFGDMSFIPHEKSNIQKLEDFVMGLPGLRTMVDEARTIYKEDIPKFWHELYTRLFSKSTIYNIVHHVSAASLIYDTVMLTVLLYFVYRDNKMSNVALIVDSLYTLIALTIYHFRETPIERVSNFVLSLFTDMKTMDVMSMFRSNWEVLKDHRSVIATFFYMLTLVGYYFMSTGFKFPNWNMNVGEKRDSPVQTSRISTTNVPSSGDVKRQ
jgi:hypothetical protein